jgi:serralysin
MGLTPDLISKKAFLSTSSSGLGTGLPGATVGTLRALGGPGLVVAGADAGTAPVVRVFDASTGVERFNFLAYGGGFLGGVRVALGDVTGDGIPDIITGAGPGAPGGHVKVFDGATGQEVRSFFAFPGFTGGVNVAAGDVNGDGHADIIVGAGPGAGAHVKVFDGATGAEVRSFFAYGGFGGGVSVAAGDVNGDGRADIITGAGAGAGPHVKVFDGATGAELASFMAFGMNFLAGVTVAAGDVDGDGRADIVVGTASGPPHVKVFSGPDQRELASFFADDPSLGEGIRVGAADVNGDGRADILTGGGAHGPPALRVFDGATTAVLDSFFALAPTLRTGLFVGGL